MMLTSKCLNENTFSQSKHGPIARALNETGKFWIVHNFDTCYNHLVALQVHDRDKIKIDKNGSPTLKHLIHLAAVQFSVLTLNEKTRLMTILER